MMNCREVEANLAGYVDGACATAQRGGIEAHLNACPSCRAHAARERAAHDLLRRRCAQLRGRAPEALHQRCAAQRALAGGTLAGARSFAQRPWVRLSLAATLVFATGLFVLFGVGTPVETYAAQLAADHIKCFQFPPQAAAADAETAGRQWHETYGWPLKVAASSAPQDLQLLGVRRCGSTRGRVAHVLYRWRGQPLSVYVLNSRIEEAADEPDDHDHPHSAVRTLGEQEIIWSQDGRTYAVVARAPLPELRQVASYVRQRIE